MKCGEEYKPPHTLIGGGDNVGNYEHPWFCDFDVTNNDGSETHCGGTLISHEYVVTAASCFSNIKHSSPHQNVMNLKCGAVNGRVPLNATKIIKRPGWDKFAHDIAVIEIQKIEYSTVIRPVCIMSREDLLLDSKLIVVGTGELHFSFIRGRPIMPQMTDIYLKNITKCQEVYGSEVDSSDKFMCAGNFWKTVKPGDSGGPLLVSYRKKYYLVGIISVNKDGFWGSYDQNNYPALFTRIKTECDFFKEHTDFECCKNEIPLIKSDEGKICGRIISFLNGSNFHPWYCRIYNKEGRDFCGATLISFKHAVTAAHCIKSIHPEEQFDLKNSFIKCGRKKEGSQQERRFKNVTLAPEYNKFTVKDDIAILEFTEDFDYDGDIVPICLPPENVFSDNMTAVGMSHNGDESRFGGRIVSEFPVQVTDKSHCIESKFQSIDSNTICTRAINKMTSKGDSGGPLVTNMIVNGQMRVFYVIEMLGNWLKLCAFFVLIWKGYCKVEIECGKEYKPLHTQIGGGRDVRDYEHPWFCDFNVINDDGTSSHCGGTLISREYIVTAAHCFDKAIYGNIYQKIANLACGTKYNRTFFQATKVIKHPG
ncbi:hypothetical protein FO519_005965, partial [Halicephalobus sp. NKZ332]